MDENPTAAERLIQHEKGTGFFADLKDIPPEQFEAFMEGLSSFYDDWLKAGMKHAQILFFTVILLGKVFEAVPTATLAKAIVHLLELQRIVDQEDGQELAAAVKKTKVRERRGWLSSLLGG